MNRENLSTRTYLPPGQWVDFNISRFKPKFGLEIVAANNVVCVSEYERKKGKAVGSDYFISLLLRYGIGACIYSNGSFFLAVHLLLLLCRGFVPAYYSFSILNLMARHFTVSVISVKLI